MSKKKSTQHTILIICEGERSEPNYFKAIREEVQKQKIWTSGVEIEIRPKPLIDKEEISVPDFHKKRRRRKKILKTLVPNDLSLNIEEKYKAVPVRYVREAQQGLDDDTFDEVWAVFDKDYHPRHKEAFQLANTPYNGNKVNVAFSSISFEQWFLLHFERNTTPFLKSECKEKKKPIDCGMGKHTNDCGGKTCVAGYLRKYGYLPAYAKKVPIYSLLSSKTKTALLNASWLRQRVKGEIYTLNPYTDVDILVKRLLKIEVEIVCLALNDSIIVAGLKIEIVQANPLSLCITNKRERSYIFKKQVSYFKKEKLLKQEEINLGLISSSATKNISLKIDADTTEFCIDLEKHQVRILLME